MDNKNDNQVMINKYIIFIYNYNLFLKWKSYKR